MGNFAATILSGFKVENYKRLDKVRLSNGHVLIITGVDLNRWANPLRGVNERGQGKEYVFGAKHCPVKIGVVSEDHPALRMSKTRAVDRLDDDLRSMVVDLIDAVESSDLKTAKKLTKKLRDAGFGF